MNTIVMRTFRGRLLPTIWSVAAAVLLLPGSVSAQDPPAAKACQTPTDDDRCDVEVTMFTGFSLDSFAAKDLKKYLNPDAAGDVQEQLVAGFNFSVRLAGGSAAAPHRQLWLYGETVHGVRSGEVDCEQQANAEVCRALDFEPPSEGAGVAPSLAIFRKSTSFEGFFGLRYEYLRLRPGSDLASGTLYLKGQAGLLTVANDGGDVIDMHHVALGVNITRGRFASSYIEAGWGTNEVFADGRSRGKIDALLSIDIGKSISPFAQIVVDADFGDKPDSIRSYFGFDVDVLSLFKE
jgi:hypothetical protein